ncbi:MAG: ABC transporter ATP-binding protein [Rhodothermales bacterium]|nr:ABC transporter ATP-binding protein [Rhodothermales bacterium]
MVLRADRLNVDLDGVPVLTDVGFEVDRGEWIALLGPNGAGKTTLLRTLGGLLEYRGHVSVAERELREWHRKELARKLAFVRQSVSLAFDFRVEDLVMLGRAPRKKWLAAYDHEDRRVTADALMGVDLADFAGRSIHSLSSGEQQRVFLAQALAQQPDIMLLDEPTAHLDIHHRIAFLGHVRNYVDSGCTVVAAFHDLELAAHFADRVLVLDGGRLAAIGSPAQTLTSDLIASVFRVRASIAVEDGNIMDIRYHENLTTAEA